MTVSSYSTTASSNTAINGINISEGCLPSDINNAIRSQLADVRSVWNDKEWFLLGDGDGTTTFTRASATSITVASDISSTYHVGRRVKVVGSNTGTIFGKIATSSYSSPNTTVTFTFDSGTINSGDTTVSVYVGSVFTNPANPVIDEDNMASDSAILPPSQQSTKAFVTSGTVTLSNKSIDLSSNTLTGTTAQFNTALSDNDFATLAGSETLTNKTLTSPIISSISNTGTLTLPTSTDTLVGRATTDTLTNKTLTNPTLSTPVIDQISNTGTLSLPTSTDTLVGKATTDTLTNKTISGSANTLSNIATTSLTGTITNAQLAGSITTDKISDSQITTAKINDDAVTIDKIADGVIVTNSEQASHTADDNTFFTSQASDSRYFRQDSTETINSGNTWSSSDSFIATTSAIDARVIDLVDDVGGFFPIANETSFPNANPDVNNGAGTIVSIKGLSQALTANGSGVITIANGTVGNSTVTINGLSASQTLGSGFGILVETTTTLNTYTFHREIAPATSTSTLSGLANEIQRLGTTDAIADMNLLGTTANVTAMSNVSDSITNVNSVASGLTNVNTVASNISGVNSFGERYRVSSSAPSTSLDSGDLYFDTTQNILRVYGTSGWQSAGSSVNGTSDRFKYVATANQTTFTGADANGETLSYDAGFIDVYKNGIRMVNGTDVTVTSGNSIVFASGCDANDIIEAVAFGTFSVASLNASNLDSGTVDNARLPSTISDKTINASTPLTVKGDGSSVDGSITLNCYVNSHGVKIMSPPHSAGQSYTLKLPDNQIAQDKFMKVKSISGSGSTAIGQLEFADVDLANLNASNLTSGTIPDARFPSVLPAVDGSNLTGITSVGGATGVDFNDNVKARFGTGNDLEIYHDGSASRIGDVGTGNLVISGTDIEIRSSNTDENFIYCVENGAVNLYYNDSKKLETTASGIAITGDVDLGDNEKVTFGNGEDLIIFHDGSNSIIKEQGGGDLMIRGQNDIFFQTEDGSETYARYKQNDAVELYHDNSKKFETTSTGVNVTGALTVNGSAVGGSNTPYFYGRKASNQSISNDTNTKVTGMTSNEIDSDNAFDGTTFTVPSGKAGKYFISGSVYGDFISGGTRDGHEIRAKIYVNGTFYSSSNFSSYVYHSVYNTDMEEFNAVVNSMIDLSVGDTVELYGEVSDYGNSTKYIGTHSHLLGYKLID